MSVPSKPTPRPFLSTSQVAAFSFIQSLTYAFPTLVGQFLEPCGYSPVVAGNASALLAGAGILGCVVLAPIMAATKKYRLLQVWVLCGTAVGVVLLLLSNRPGNVVGAPRLLAPLLSWLPAPLRTSQPSTRHTALA